MNFLVDTCGDKSLLNQKSASKTKKRTSTSESKSLPAALSFNNHSDEEYADADFLGLPPPSIDISHILNKFPAKVPESKGDKTPLGCTKNDFDDLDDLDALSNELSKQRVKKEMKNVASNSISFKEAMPLMSLTKAAALRKEERSKTRGKDWFDLPATSVTPEIKNDLKLLQMRSALNPKQFYKKNDMSVLPKYFQVGTVLPSALDRRQPKKETKKKSLVDELMADAEFKKFNKRKYAENVKNTKTFGGSKKQKKR